MSPSDGNDGAYGMTFNFDIDGDKLDGLTPQRVFVLGYEVGYVRGRMSQIDENQSESDEVIYARVHSLNEERICRLIEESGRTVKSKMWHDDWIDITAYHENPDG